MTLRATSRTSWDCRTAVVFAAAMFAAAPLVAQTPSASPANAPAAADITAEMLARHVEALAADSFRGRTTPSAALERTARYIADQFARVGLVPVTGSDEKTAGPWLRRYPVPGGAWVDTAATAIMLTVLDSTTQAMLAKGEDRRAVESAFQSAAPLTDTAWLNRSAYFAMPLIPLQPMAVDGASWATVVVAGPPVSDSAAVERLANQVAGKSVLYVPPAGLDSTALARMVAQLATAAGHGVLVLAPDDSATFAARWRAAQKRLPMVVEYTLQNALRPHGWIAYAWPGALTGALAAARLDLAALRAAPSSVVRAAPALKVDLQLGTTQADSTWPTVPNVFGWLEGRDSARSKDFVVIMAHMDEAAPSSGGLDSAAVGTTPLAASSKPSNRLGVAGLLALAQAFSRPEARPRRSVLFLATSGGATPSMSGAHYSLEIMDGLGLITRAHTFAALLNLDQLEHPEPGAASGDLTATDSVWVDGLREVEHMPTVDWIAAAHPELGLTVLDGGTALAPHSDHFGFLRLHRPMLYFHTTPPEEPKGAEADNRARSTVPAIPVTVTARAMARGARIAQLAFYVASEVANAAQMPRLNAIGNDNFTEAVEHLP